MRINPNAIFFVAFTSGIGHLFFNSWAGGFTVGAGIVLVATLWARD
jgi:hypothetical protein